jgi:exosortase A-associated hydrolase 2
MEIPVFFKNQSYNLFGVLHQPEDKISSPSPALGSNPHFGLVFCHPFAEEKLISHRTIVNLARCLAKTGIWCLRFDYMGHGDSEGNFEDSTIESRISDINCAVNYLKEQAGVQNIGLLGVRLGATIASLACNNTLINFLVLIAPILRGKTYIEQCLRSNLATQMAAFKQITKDRNELISDLQADRKVNIDGYLLTKQIYLQIAQINLLELPLNLPQNTLLIQVTKKETQPYEKDLNSFYLSCKQTGISVKLLSVCDSFFWTEAKKYIPKCNNLQDTIANWINSSFDLSKEHTA